MTIPMIYAFLSVFIVSLIALIGVVALSVNVNKLKKFLIYSISFSAGALIGGAFLHLLPEAVEENGGFSRALSLYVIMGIVIAFVMEKFIHWRHCHLPVTSDHEHPFVWMNLFGDGVHNFIDGTIIAAAYLVSIPVGIATTTAVILHEIPQEIGDFGVLIHGGFSVKKAIFFNFLTALTAVLGVGVVFIFGSYTQNLVSFLVPFAAGNFIYIASTDLIPELHKENAMSKSALQLIWFVLGIAIMFFLVYAE